MICCADQSDQIRQSMPCSYVATANHQALLLYEHECVESKTKELCGYGIGTKVPTVLLQICCSQFGQCIRF